MRTATFLFCFILAAQVLGAQGNLPTAVSVSPSSGSGLSQVFTFTFSDPNGASDIKLMYMAVANFGMGEPNTCIVLHINGVNTLALLADNNGTIAGDVVIGTSQTASNSQCTISGSGGAPVVSGNTITVPVAITFKPVFNGHKNIYGVATNRANQIGPAQQLGTWTPSEPALAAVSITPNMGAGPGGTFTAMFSDANGASDVQVVYLVFKAGPPEPAPNACFVAFVPATNQIYLFNDTDTDVVPGSPITGGMAGTLQNNQCIVSGSGGTATLSGNNLTVPINVTFKASTFGTPEKIWGLVQRYETAPAAQSGWTQLGTWTPAGAP